MSKLPTIRRATEEQRAAWFADPNEIYPLYGYVVMDHGTLLPLEDLRGHWGRPDPVWEVHAPDGYHFAFEGTHSMLGETLQDIRERVQGVRLVRCGEECRGWIREEKVDNPGQVEEEDIITE